MKFQMKPLMLIAALLLSASSAFAQTKGFFPNGNARAMITIQTPSLGNPDQDAQDLYQSMNVPVQDSFVGPGKTIQYGNNLMTLICAIRNGGLYTCTVLIQQSVHARISAQDQTAEFSLGGQEALQLWALFTPNDGNEFKFQTSDQKLMIRAQENEFRVSFDGR